MAEETRGAGQERATAWLPAVWECNTLHLYLQLSTKKVWCQVQETGIPK